MRTALQAHFKYRDFSPKKISNLPFKKNMSPSKQKKNV